MNREVSKAIVAYLARSMRFGFKLRKFYTVIEMIRLGLPLENLIFQKILRKRLIVTKSA